MGNRQLANKTILQMSKELSSLKDQYSQMFKEAEEILNKKLSFKDSDGDIISLSINAGDQYFTLRDSARNNSLREFRLKIDNVPKVLELFQGLNDYINNENIFIDKEA